MTNRSVRTSIALSERQLRALALICRRERISQAEALRRAVSEFVEARATKPSEDAFGLWRGRVREGLDYQRSVRREW